MTYELVVGLEIHAQLLTATKAFCRCANRYGEPPNSLTCPTCLGLPGALPVLNQEVVRQATRLALALEATIHPHSKFDRKNYFYPDLPKGYQISQFDEPFSTGGQVRIEVGRDSRSIRITRAHIEEDAGKSMHLADGTTIVDMNRCGVPLIEIVSEPELRTPEEAGAFVTSVRELLRYVEVCDGNMEQGSLRCDANISVRPCGQASLNERTEVKNLNSIRAVERAIRTEFDRQVALYRDGGTVHRETLLWDESSEELRPMRRKEGSDDYRYFPEPDLVELRMDADYVARIASELPELPASRRHRYRHELHLHEEAVSFLTSERAVSDYFEALLKLGVEPRSAANWLQGEVRRGLADRNWTIGDFTIPPAALAELISLVQKEVVSVSLAKDVFRRMLSEGRTAREIIEAEGLSQVADPGQLQAILTRIIAEYPEEVSRYRSGKKNLFGFFVGQAMKASGGQANPKVLSTLLKEMLDR